MPRKKFPKNGLDPLFKEVRVFKGVPCTYLQLQASTHSGSMSPSQMIQLCVVTGSLITWCTAKLSMALCNVAPTNRAALCGGMDWWHMEGTRIEHKLSFSNISGTPRISRKNPEISRPKSLISLVSRDISNFLAPTPSRGRPLPHRKISGLRSLGLCSFFA